MLHPWNTSPSPSLRCCIIGTCHLRPHWDTVPSNNLQPHPHIPIPVLFCEVRCFMCFARWVSGYPTKPPKAPHLIEQHSVSGVATGDSGYSVYRYCDISGRTSQSPDLIDSPNQIRHYFCCRRCQSQSADERCLWIWVVHLLRTTMRENSSDSDLFCQLRRQSTSEMNTHMKLTIHRRLSGSTIVIFHSYVCLTNGSMPILDLYGGSTTSFLF